MLALDERLLRALRVLRGRVAPADLLRPGSGEQQRLKVSVYEWEFLNVIRAKIERNISTVRFELRYLACDFDRLRDLANLQLRIDARRRIHLYQHAWHVIRFEARSLDVYLVGVWNEVNYGKVPAVIRGCRFARPLGDVGHCDFCSRYGVPLRVRHCANNAAVHGLT